MNPILVIEGKAHEIKAINYYNGKLMNVLIEQNGHSVFYWENSMSIDESVSISVDDVQWNGRYEPIYQAIDDLIAEYKVEIERLSKNIAELYVDTGSVDHSLVKRYQELKQRLFGTNRTKEMIEEVVEHIRK